MFRAPLCNDGVVTPNHSGNEDETPGEECGVFGIHAPGSKVAHMTYLGLYALQHRGQESAGMATSDGDHLMVVKDMGLVSNVFNDRTLDALDGDLAIGHTRYSTTGSSMWKNSQPLFRAGPSVQFALAHNGNLVNTAELADRAGMLEGTVNSDTDVMAELILKECGHVDGDTADQVLVNATEKVLTALKGAFSLVMMSPTCVIAARDPHGFRPLCLGELDTGWVVASETPALDVVGARFVRELEPGEMVVIDSDGVRSIHPFPPEEIDPKLCIFEFVYFARPDSRLYDHSVHLARVRMGEALADQAPADADMVMGVPESGIPAAEGFARRSGVPFGQGLVKNRYIGRTFIAPTQEMRALGVRMKLNPLKENIAGKRLVVVDDSIVRGTTTRGMIEMLRSAGAAEIHMRISSPPYKWPCYYGMDTGSRDQLLAARMDPEEIREFIGVDTLAFLTLDGLISAIGVDGDQFCTACLTGDYPTELPPEAYVSITGSDRTDDEPTFNGRNGQLLIDPSMQPELAGRSE